jgi:hypothetical protein
VKIRFFGKEVALIVCFVLLMPAFTLSAEDKLVGIQGEVMGLNVINKTVTVNEKTFVWDQNTLFYDEKGSPVTADKLKKNVKVFIEATWGKNKPYTITKIYISPK